MHNGKANRFIGIGSLVGMFLGIMFGLAARTDVFYAVEGIPYAELFAKTWIVVLIGLAVPLVAFFLLASLLRLLKTKQTGKLVLRGFSVHLVMLTLAAVLSVAISFILVQFIPATSNLDSLFTGTGKSHILSDWISHISSAQTNIARLIIPIIAGTVLLAIIIHQFSGEFKNTLVQYAHTISAKLFNVLHYVFMLLPFSVASLSFVITYKYGAMLVGVAGFYLLGVCGVLLFFIGVQYLSVLFFGCTSVKQFTRAIAPAQLVAASSCSSMATLPALLISVKRLGIREAVAGATVPIFVSFFRINLMVANPFSFFLLSRLYDLPVEWPNLLFFLALMMLTSFGSPGLPQTGNVYSLPVFLAAGIPLEGVVLLKALDSIPDIFKTVLNITETGAVTSIMMRWTTRSSPVEPQQAL